MSQQLTLISHTLCPYVQRAIIILEEKGIEYKRVDIDLNNKPEWFLNLSPLGKVPVLVIDEETVIFESAVISEYINDVTSAGLLAEVAIDRAQQKAWNEFASATINNIGQLYNAETKDQFDIFEENLHSKWLQLEHNHSGKKFFSGEQFSLVDAAFAPVFRYLDLFEKLTPMKSVARYSILQRWRDTLQKRLSVVSAVSDDYQNLLLEFITKRDSYLSKKAEQYLVNLKAA